MKYIQILAADFSSSTLERHQILHLLGPQEGAPHQFSSYLGTPHFPHYILGILTEAKQFAIMWVPNEKLHDKHIYVQYVYIDRSR